MIVCLTLPQMNDFGDLLGTPYAPVSKIAPVKMSACLRVGGVSPCADGQKVTVHKDQKSPS